MSDLLVSDVHLRGQNDPRQGEFIRFLEQKANEIENLFVVGDLLDLWFGMKPVLVREYYPVLSLLKRLSRSGTRVHYFEGNHDFNLRPYIEDSVEARVLETAEWKFGGRRTHLHHGDGLDPGDVKYRALKGIVRSSSFQTFTKVLPGRFAWWLGTRFSSASRNYLGRDRPQFEAQRAFAKDRVHEGFDVVVLGHAHVPGIFPVASNGRKGIFINTGDWLTHFTYVEFREGTFEMKTMDGRPLDASVPTREEVA